MSRNFSEFVTKGEESATVLTRKPIAPARTGHEMKAGPGATTKAPAKTPF